MRKSNLVSNWILANIDKHYCKCGCGEFVTPNLTRYYRDKCCDFIAGHQNRGSNHPNFKGGVVTAKGYIWVLCNSHHRSTPRGYVKRCWLVIEKKLGRLLLDGELVHHKNMDKQDDSPENLEIKDSSAHAKEHSAERIRDSLGRYT